MFSSSEDENGTKSILPAHTDVCKSGNSSNNVVSLLINLFDITTDNIAAIKRTNFELFKIFQKEDKSTFSYSHPLNTNRKINICYHVTGYV